MVAVSVSVTLMNTVSTGQRFVVVDTRTGGPAGPGGPNGSVTVVVMDVS